MLFLYKLPVTSVSSLCSSLPVCWLNDSGKRMIANHMLLDVIITSVMVSIFTLELL